MTAPTEAKAPCPLAVMDAFRCGGNQQVCCGFPYGGGMDENGNGEPPECCGRFFDNDDLLEARAAVAELVEHVRDLSRGMPLSYADNARVIGNSNALVLEKIRADLAKFGGAA